MNFSTREIITVGEKFRLRAQSDNATMVVMQTKNLDFVVCKQPALRISINEVK